MTESSSPEISALEMLKDKYNSITGDFDWRSMDWDNYFNLLNVIKKNRGLSINLISANAASKAPPERFLAASLAGAVMNPVEENEAENARLLIKTLSEMSEGEKSVEILDAIAMALGYPYMVEAKQTLLKLSKNEDLNVRLSATISLGSLTVEDDKDVIERLHELENDPDQEISDWAQFNLKTVED